MFRSPFADGVVIIIILLLFFGPKQLPKLSRSLGESAKELKRGFARDEDEKKPEGEKTSDADKEPATTKSGSAEK
jgi:sec-independent protein translocase protein TatA